MKIYFNFVILFCMFLGVVSLFDGGDCLYSFADKLDQITEMNTNSGATAPSHLASFVRTLAWFFDFAQGDYMIHFFGKEESLTGLDLGFSNTPKINSILTFALPLLGLGFIVRFIFRRTLGAFFGLFVRRAY